MTNPNLIDRIAATIRRVDGSNTMGAGALGEAIAEDLGDLVSLGLVLVVLAEHAAQLRRECENKATGNALACIVDAAAMRVERKLKGARE